MEKYELISNDRTESFAGMSSTATKLWRLASVKKTFISVGER